jgi:hypothetical protein
MGVAIYAGYYTGDDIYTATPLHLYDPNAVYHCPMILSRIDSYVFRPSSNTADVFGSCESGPCLEDFKVGETFSYAGFWTDSADAQFTNFLPGIYTVACGDEWGTLAIIHFLVLDDTPPMDKS